MIALAFGMHLIATALVAGVPFFAVVILPRNPVSAASGRKWLDDTLARHIAIGLGAAAITALLWLWAAASGMSGQNWIQATSVIPKVLVATHFGHVWLVRLATMAVLAGLLAVNRLPNSRFPKGDAAALLALVLLVSLAATGHAAGDIRGMLVQGVHLVAAGIWFGGLWALRLALLSIADTGFAYRVTERFGIIALFAVGVLAASGVMNALVHAPHPSMLLGTGYGGFLIGKTVLFAAALIVAAVNRWGFLPRLAGDSAEVCAHLPLARSIAIEATIVMMILLLAGFVATTPPPHG